MRLPTKILWYVLGCVILLYGTNNFVFERQLFFNELLALIGFVFLIENLFKKEEELKIRFPKSKIFKYVLLVIVIGFVHLLISLLTKTSWYFYFRNSVIVYSIFSFFIGFFAFQQLKETFKTLRWPLVLYLLYGLAFPAVYLIDRFTSAVMFPLLFRKVKWWVIVGIVSLDILLAIRYESLTVILISLILLGIILIRSYKVLKLTSIVLIIASAAAFIYFAPNLKAYKAHPVNVEYADAYSLFGNIRNVANSNKLLSIDGNSTWRAVFWKRVIVERFPENLFGIGMGTPLINHAKNEDTVNVEHDDNHDVHVSGAHNTYLTLTLRLGIGFLILIVLIFKEILYEFYTYREFYNKREELIFFISFFSIAIIGLFNLVLETPAVASLFWILLGFVASIIHKRHLIYHYD